VQTLSNAMDVGNPSNWIRIAHIFQDPEKLKQLLTACSYTDGQTKQAIEAIYKQYGYVVCPHTAIAWQALKDYQKAHPAGKAAGIFLATAHPCKFPEVFSDKISAKIVVPEQVKELEGKPSLSVALGTDFAGFKQYLINNA
jgi:threonine synthase